MHLTGMLFLSCPPLLAMVEPVFPRTFRFTALTMFGIRPIHVEKPFCVQPPRMTQDLGRPSVVYLSFQHLPSCSSSMSCFFAHFRQQTFFACLISVFLLSSGHVSFILINLPSLILKTCQLRTVTPGSHFTNDCTCPPTDVCPRCSVAPHTCLFACFSQIILHCIVQTACAQKHVCCTRHFVTSQLSPQTFSL